jgi:hypothetical protein
MVCWWTMRPGRGRQDEHAVGEVDGLGEVVGDGEGGEAVALPQAQELVVEAFAGEFVEGAEGLVEEEQLGAGDQGAGERGAHAHAARELGGVGVREFAEADEGEHAVDGGLRRR